MFYQIQFPLTDRKFYENSRFKTLLTVTNILDYKVVILEGGFKFGCPR